MIINNNIPALNTHRQMGVNQNAMQSSMEKLSSGLRINRAGDDAAGLSISEKMRAQINGLDQASRNAQDGISLIQTAEGALDETHNILQRMRELAVQSANDTNVNEGDREAIQAEVDALADEISRISANTEFNTQGLLDGSFDGKFHIGANGGQNIDLAIDNMSANALGVAGQAGFKLDVEVTEGVDAEDLQIADNDTLQVQALSESIEVDGTEYNFALRNDDNEIVGLSETGQEYVIFDAGESSVTDVNNVTAAHVDTSGGDAHIFDFGNTVVDGTINVSVDAGEDPDDITLSATATIDSGNLLAGDYTVVDDNTTGVPASGFGLVNESGGLVATSTDGRTFSDLNGATVLEIAAANEIEVGDVGDTFTVSGGGGLSVSTQEDADRAIETINAAIVTVSEQRSALGAVQNRLEHTISNLDNASENLSAAESRIRDVDMAAEMMEMTRSNILSQASQSMLAQANQQPQSVLQLLG